MASTFGGLFSACALLFTAPLLSKIALNFGVPEMFALGVFGLSIVTAVSSHSIIKGLIGAILGLLLGTVGIDATSATMRFTFGTTYLIGGVQFVALLIGLFAFSQCLVTAEESMKEYKREKRKKLDQILPSKSDIKRTSPTILMCSIIGTIIGAIPEPAAISPPGSAITSPNAGPSIRRSSAMVLPKASPLPRPPTMLSPAAP